MLFLFFLILVCQSYGRYYSSSLDVLNEDVPAAFTPEAGYFINRRSVSWLIGASVVTHGSESAWVTQHGVGSGKGSLWPHHVMAGARMYPCVVSLSL